MNTVSVIQDEAVHTVQHASHGQGTPVAHSVWGTAIRFTIVTAILFGLAYPLVMTGLREPCFPIAPPAA